MFNRAAGWVVCPSFSGYMSHYFKENQTKALCGNAHSTIQSIEVDADPLQGNPACVRCRRYSCKPLKTKPLKRIKNTKWGGLKY